MRVEGAARASSSVEVMKRPLPPGKPLMRMPVISTGAARGMSMISKGRDVCWVRGAGVMVVQAAAAPRPVRTSMVKVSYQPPEGGEAASKWSPSMKRTRSAMTARS